MRHTHELCLSRRCNELDAVRNGDMRLDARRQGKPALDLEPGCEEHGFDRGSDGRDVLEPRLSLACLVGGDE